VGSTAGVTFMLRPAKLSHFFTYICTSYLLCRRQEEGTPSGAMSLTLGCQQRVKLQLASLPIIDPHTTTLLPSWHLTVPSRPTASMTLVSSAH
jgi:hypothetical protein